MKKQILLISLIGVSMVSCTDNVRTKLYGGNMNLELPENTKLVNVTWKEGNLWYLTKNMDSSDVAETYTFQEKSSLGIAEGCITITERKK